MQIYEKVYEMLLTETVKDNENHDDNNSSRS